MSKLVKTLRQMTLPRGYNTVVLIEAADKICDLKAEVERLQRKLQIEAQDGNRYAEKCGELEARLTRLLEGLNSIGKQPHESWGASDDYKLGWHDVREMVEANIKEAQAD